MGGWDGGMVGMVGGRWRRRRTKIWLKSICDRRKIWSIVGSVCCLHTFNTSPPSLQALHLFRVRWLMDGRWGWIVLSVIPIMILMTPPEGWGLIEEAQRNRAWVPPTRSMTLGATGDIMTKYAQPDYEVPTRDVSLPGFWMDVTEVSNARFAAWAWLSGHKTEAETSGGSIVFSPSSPSFSARRDGSWGYVPSAWWRHPEGPGSDLGGRWGHPVVHVSAFDAAAFCSYWGGRLPSEAEIERVLKADPNHGLFPWGDDEVDGNGRYRVNAGEGGEMRTTKGCAYGPVNDLGVCDLVGNVWEWTSENDHRFPYPDVRVLKGGSFLCSRASCFRYRVSSRTGHDPGEGASNIGFRCVYDPM